MAGPPGSRAAKHVSIPHRYAKNIAFTGFLKRQEKVSIPHRYAKNVTLIKLADTYRAVSIPHRYAKNETEIENASRIVVFQFLIGTLKTKRLSA